MSRQAASQSVQAKVTEVTTSRKHRAFSCCCCRYYFIKIALSLSRCAVVAALTFTVVAVAIANIETIHDKINCQRRIKEE